MADQKTGLVITAHPGDFVWRAGGAVALHAKMGYRVKIVCMSFGERGESQFAWKEPGATLESVKAGRKDEAERAAALLGAEIEFFDCGDYPLKLNEQHFDRMVDIYRELNPAFVLTHALEDPYNFDHPNAAHFAQETRVVAQAMGHKPGAKYKYSAPPVYLFEPHQPEQCNYKPDLILKIDDVWEQKYKAFQILAAQKHLWGYYERVALNRGIQGSRNSGIPMTYGEAYQTLFPRVVTGALG
jgi:4-oxalomesaconate hydratase